MTPEDVPAAEQLRADAFYEVDLRFALRGGPEPERRAPGNALAWVRRTARLLETDAGGQWVAADDSGLLGFACSVVRERLWVLVTFAVRPGLQGKGIGRQLQARAEAYGAGCERWMLSASDDPLALRRYHAAGFALYPQMVFQGRSTGRRSRSSAACGKAPRMTRSGWTYSTATCAAPRTAPTM